MFSQSVSVKRVPAPVPWIKPGDPNPPGSHTRQPSEIKTENEQFSLLDKVWQASYIL